MAAPAVTALILIFVGPVLYTVYLSLHSWSFSGVSEPEFVGLHNFFQAFREPAFLNSLRVTAIFTLGGVSLQTIVGVSIAQFLNRQFVGKNLTRTIFILPLAGTPVAMALVWRLMLHPTLGVLNHFITRLKLTAVPWLSIDHLVLPALLVVDTWQWFPLVMLIAMSAMMTIPTQLYESAAIDGATRRQSFVHITLPLIRPAIIVAMMLRLTDSLKHFDMIYVMTQGGPGNSSQILNLYIYDNSFRYFRMGYSSAVIVLLFLVILFLNYILSRLRRINI